MRRTGLSRQLSYAPMDTLTTTLVMLLPGPRRNKKEQPKRPLHARIESKTLFFFSMTLILVLLGRARVPVTLSRMSVATATVPVFGSPRLAFGNTDSVWPDFHFPKKSNTAIQSASRDHFFFGASFDLAITTSQAKVS